MNSLERKFSEKLSSILGREKASCLKLAVAVSGGADSLALLFLASKWAKENNCELVALTVDHGLREDSREEAEYVAKISKDLGVEHHILSWDGDVEEGNLEAKARTARYGLLSGFCKDNDVLYVMTGHHKLDQVETFLMRLQRGSGLDGLTAMSEVSVVYELNVIRPLLDFNPEDLKKYLEDRKIGWKEDYLNQDESFLRVKFRKAIPFFEDLGISIDKIYNTTKILDKSRDYINSQVDKFIKNNARFLNSYVVRVSYDVLKNSHDEIVYRVLSKILKEVGKKDYSPISLDVTRVCELIKNSEKIACTLSNCEIFSEDKYIWIVEELKNKPDILKKDMEEFLIENKLEKINMPYKAKKVLYYTI